MDKRGNTKDKIALHAWKLFHEKGYESTTIDDILMASGVAKSSFYHYFSGKDSLLASLSHVFDSKYREIMKTLDPEMNSFDKLLQVCFEIHDMIERDIPAGLLSSLYASQASTKGDRHLLDKNRYYYEMLYQLVDEGQRRGQITRDIPMQEVAHLYTISERAIVYDYCISNENFSLGEYTRKAMPLLFGCVKQKG